MKKELIKRIGGIVSVFTLTISPMLLTAGSHIELTNLSDDAKKEYHAQGKTSGISEDYLGLRKVDLYSEDTVEPNGTAYSTDYAGGSKKLKRSFQDAPPMIPHSVEGMLPITIKNNQCTGCHMPVVAASVGATAIPVSHMTNFRPSVKLVGQDFKKSEDVVRNDVAITKTKDGKLTGARFNCSQCHAPQTTKGAVVENTFEAVYTHKNGDTLSTWSDDKYMKNIDTIKGEAGKVTNKDIANKDSVAGHLGGSH